MYERTIASFISSFQMLLSQYNIIIHSFKVIDQNMIEIEVSVLKVFISIVNLCDQQEVIIYFHLYKVIVDCHLVDCHMS